MFGYWRPQPYPKVTNFSKCLYPASCLGAPNHDLEHLFGKAALANRPEGCNVEQGYRDGSRLCADCLPGYSRDGRGKCKPCSGDGLNVFFPILASIGILMCLFFLVWTTVPSSAACVGSCGHSTYPYRHGSTISHGRVVPLGNIASNLLLFDAMGWWNFCRLPCMPNGV